ncbi:MAG: hypothetical protein J6S41_00275, partial [Clostridia bacterium]|nr:hypothetical protein [Clostridia bacterium]
LGDTAASLPETLPVTFHAPNAVSLEYFIHNGAAVTKDEDVPTLAFPFTVTDELDGLSVMIPTFCLKAITAVKVDGVPLWAHDAVVFDDPYSAFAVPKLSVGAHVLEIEKTAPLTADCLLFLSGAFDVSVACEHVFHKSARYTYNLRMYIPESAEVVLSARRSVLDTARPWSAQGQPFYSGGVTYHASVHVPHDGRYCLSLCNVRDTVLVSVNGGEAQKCFRQPYDLILQLCGGENRIDITVYNSYANLLEGYAEEGGLLCGGTLRPILSEDNA